MVVARKVGRVFGSSVAGRGAHAGGKHNHGANAIVQLGQTLQQASDLTDYQRDLTVNVGTISGGTVLNRVPHEAVAEGEMQAFTPKAFCRGQARLARVEWTGHGQKSHRRLRLSGEGGDPV